MRLMKEANMNKSKEKFEPIVDLGQASVLTQGTGAGATDFNQQPRTPMLGGLTDD